MSLSQIELEQDCINSIESDNIDRIKQLVSSAFSVNAFLRSKHKIWDTNCFSILAIASFYGSKNIVQFLLEKKVQVNQVDSLTNRIALHWSIAASHYEISKLLIEAGSFVNAIDRDSITPLILASNMGDLAIVKILILNGAKLNHTDRMNSTALHYACFRSHGEIARELIVNGCIYNTNTPFSFSSPLRYLVLDRKYAVAKCLVESGCDLNIERKWIFDDAFVQKHAVDPEFIKWLRNHVKKPPTLMMLCRQKIRHGLGSQHLAVKVHSLVIPKFLKQYLMMQF